MQTTMHDWRAPTIEELKTLLREKENNDYHIKYPLSKNNYLYEWCWSSSPVVSDSSYAWGVNFLFGEDWNDRSDSGLIRCVRDSK